MPSQQSNLRAPQLRRSLLLVLILAGSSACNLIRGVAEAPGEIVEVATGKKGEKHPLDLARARAAAAQLADRIVFEISTATTAFHQSVGTPEAQDQALNWAIQTADRAYAAATRPQPVAALAELAIMTEYEKRLHELHWSARWPEPDRVMLEAWERLAQDSLAEVDRCLPKELAGAVRNVVSTWSGSVNDAESLVHSGAPRFMDLVKASKEEDEARTSLLGTIGLDPLDSLEPAAREVARSRELGERALFLAQRAPRVLSWRVELATLRLAAQPAISRLIDDVDRTSKSVESFAATAQTLPERIATERAALVADLERVSVPTKELLAQTSQTLDAGTRFVEALKKPKAVDERREREKSEQETPGKPFDPADYAELATNLTGTLHELNGALERVDRGLPAIQGALEETATRLDGSVERAYGFALRLVLLAALLGAALVALAAWLRRARRTERALT